ncbi:MAG: permease-like cell division protein FtsX [Thermacetogeniaceae bacterium]
MLPKTWIYIVQETLRSLKRNGWLNFAAAGTTAVSLFILGVAILLVIDTNFIASSVESNVEIMTYLQDRVQGDAITALRTQIQAIPEVKEVSFISKDQALTSLEQQFGQSGQLRESLGGTNPLPDAFKVSTTDPRDVTGVANLLSRMPGVDKVRYGQGVVEKLLELTYYMRLIGLTIVVLLALCAIFLIATTIQLTMFARRREIGIMKSVGATDWYVRWPFLLEGIILGGAGAVVAVAVLFFSYSTLASKVMETLPFVPLMYNNLVLMQLFLSLLAAGVGLGIIGSLISVHRYLQA